MNKNKEKIIFPEGYLWLIKNNIVGYDAFTQLQPWYYLKDDECFFANERWPHVTNKNLYVFARHQDNDELAAFQLNSLNQVEDIYLINGWTSEGFEILQELPDFWSWLHLVVDDMQQWIALEE